MEAKAEVGAAKFGTGLSIFSDEILPAIEDAKHEVILVTCFWAASPTLTLLGESLLKLSKAAEEQDRKVRVRIGFSSASITQKLLQRGPRIYDRSEYQSKLGLPAALHDHYGLDLEVKSTFFLPFSVWHPKFVIVDRRLVLLPSCNVSWEEWFEVCVSLTGPIVSCFLKFWNEHWASSSDRGDHPSNSHASRNVILGREGNYFADVSCHFLPSPHSRNPRFRFPWQQPVSPPQTPLNVHLLDLFASARQEIYLQTPNVTSLPVLSALLEALGRGVEVNVNTSERLMVLEQMVTAGTTTSRCMQRLINHYKLLSRRPSDEEIGMLSLGRLRISYYKPRDNVESEPVQAHAKLTIVDESTVVFGSGNMDRASWYTSQELGVAFFSGDLARRVKVRLQEQMKGRATIRYDSSGDMI